MTAARGVTRSPRWIGLLLATALLLWMAALPVHAAEPTFPALTGRVVDQARLLSPEKEAEITAKLAQLETDTGDQFVVVTLNSLQDNEIEDYGYRLGRAWGIGNAENDSGVLLIIAPNERKVRIEVGYGLEPVLTDALSSQIIQNDILPPFRESGFERGISAGVDAVIAQLKLDPVEAQARAAAAAEPPQADFPIIEAVFIGLIFLFWFLNLFRAGGRRGRRRRGLNGVAPILMWEALNAASSSSRGSSSSSDFGGGGGGFSGGGGSFGGGGASGGW